MLILNSSIELNPWMELMCSELNNRVMMLYTTDGSPPTTYLSFIPVDMHLDKTAYLQRKKRIKWCPAGAHLA